MSIEHEPISEEQISDLRLGIQETEGIRGLRETIIRLVKYRRPKEIGEQEELVKFMREHRMQLEAVAQGYKDLEGYRKAQIGVILVVAQLKLDIGLIDEAIEEIEDAIDMAYGMGFEGLAHQLLNIRDRM